MDIIKDKGKNGIGKGFQKVNEFKKIKPVRAFNQVVRGSNLRWLTKN